MRILAFFAKYTFLLLLLVVGVFLVAREALLLTATHTLKKSIAELVLVSHKGTTASSCRAKGLSENVTGTNPTLQLRFISDTEYVLEVNCVQNSIDPVLLNKKVLPPFVTKKQGGSGFTLSPEQSAVELEVFRDVEDLFASWLFFEPTFITRSATVAASAGTLIEDFSINDFDNGPVTSCTGYGYFCCDGVAEKGVGSTISGLAGCEKSCYSQCVTRPLVLSFTTSPFYDFQTRALAVNKGETIEFSYVSDPGKGNTVTAAIDYGDGAKDSLTTDTGTMMHKYACTQPKCEFTATLTLVDNWGIESAVTEVSKVKVTIQ
ncbi:MAG: hypothetical protein CO156_01390 [Candidatus Pacebacteria bacterium CG_4_9_14_3_um_filter_40_12]|nr:MAG: hypothetical protein COY01_01445 [Candidatus Pacebacteria bacterium CG_4_10_14_0_2_um_filter_40_20]PJA69238.1 MAG: hypothetical protein CO156_01390 [Candidatus Pacebacteria bacterium CG_4_9_14_3_um_filter_40_12]PJC42040.1 MAG: hypothetical protein CO041_00155 [Candidatus Pacebacteria bacterium CG_4_9_14_0_2_um_filter_40_15]